jgi:hypothetical protein
MSNPPKPLHEDISRLVGLYKTIPSGFRVSRDSLNLISSCIKHAELELEPYDEAEEEPDPNGPPRGLTTAFYWENPLTPPDSEDGDGGGADTVKDDGEGRDKDTDTVADHDDVYGQYDEDPATDADDDLYEQYGDETATIADDNVYGQYDDDTATVADDEVYTRNDQDTSEDEIFRRAMQPVSCIFGGKAHFFPALGSPCMTQMWGVEYGCVQQPGESVERAKERVKSMDRERRLQCFRSSTEDHEHEDTESVQEEVSSPPQALSVPEAETSRSTSIEQNGRRKRSSRGPFKEAPSSSLAQPGAPSKTPSAASKDAAPEPGKERTLPDRIMVSKFNLYRKIATKRAQTSQPRKSYLEPDETPPSGGVARLSSGYPSRMNEEHARPQQVQAARVAQGHAAVSAADATPTTYLPISKAAMSKYRSPWAALYGVERNSYLHVTYTAPIPDQVETTVEADTAPVSDEVGTVVEPDTPTDIDDQPLLLEDQPKKQDDNEDLRKDSQGALVSGTPFILEECLNDSDLEYDDDKPEVAPPSVLEKRKKLTATSATSRQSRRVSRRAGSQRSSRSSSSRSPSPDGTSTTSVIGKRDRKADPIILERKTKRSKAA